MKSRWILLAATAMLCSCVGQPTPKTTQDSTAKMTTERTQAAPEPEENQSAQLCGGFTEQRPLKTNEEQLFDAMTWKIDSVSYKAKSVATQVVAGTNYKYLCTATPKSGGAPYLVELTIYLPLHNSGKSPQITHIERCSE